MSKYSTLNARVEAYEELVFNRARKLTLEAGLDPTLLGIHPHNAMVSFEAGRPWSNVDYKKIRKVLWLTRDIRCGRLAGCWKDIASASDKRCRPKSIMRSSTYKKEATCKPVKVSSDLPQSPQHLGVMICKV